ncbi:3-isopropylmalate/(R)-2-methylmalate dehydratase large subunit [Candidatus Caldarchaeum subterraneum]|uniref:3-isopropylmalate dehydratase n=2 Tax=Caldiarchaeum subterraneum TaxID=311458 RepID=E6P954_CALS0|nr:3-isopropylmalate/(R)-2-methylmalate dehydratase large subunit [Candidatus Caldarchaeum subterraneum]
MFWRGMGYTVFEKIWNSHALAEREDGQTLLYIDRHLTHEVTSPLAFEGLRAAGRRVRRPDLTFAVMDHNVPTGDRLEPVRDPMSAAQMQALSRNAREFGITLFDYFSPFQGIVHVIGPELGFTIPGITLVCGDSHTSTHGAFGALAFGIGTSEGEHVFATQTLWLKKPKQMNIRLMGKLGENVTAKDVILYIIRKLGTGGCIGHVVEFTGDYVRSIGVEERMTLTNMSIEGGARTAIIEPDEKVFNFLKDAPYSPKGREWDEAMEYWRTLKTDPGAKYDTVHEFDVSRIEPQVTWGTNPAMTVGVTENVPSPDDFDDPSDRKAVERALQYMGLKPGMKVSDIKVDTVFIGSCTNARLSDLIDVARLVKGRKKAEGVRVLVVPGSQLTKRRAERMGLHRIFMEAGFEWRNSGCSMCIAMNEDRLRPGERCLSTSNRNFENRQGVGGRTHLASPLVAAATALTGKITDPRQFPLQDL